MYIGSTDYSKIYIGSSPVVKVYKGTTQVYSGYETESLALFARMDVQPTIALKDLINKTIKDFKTAGIWDKHKRLYCRRLHTLQASLLDWKGITDAVAYNSPIFRAGYGIKGDKISKHIRMAFAPSAILTENSYGYWFQMITAPTAAGLMIMGSNSGSFYRTNVDYLVTPSCRGALGGQLSSTRLGVINGSVVSFDRSAIGQTHNWINGGSKSSPLVNNNGGISSSYICELATGTTGSPVSYSDIEIGWSGWKDIMTDQQELDLYNIVKNFNDNVINCL